ncbi:MAG: SIS domain-containing protein [Anaerolineales bacterium]|nr:SIS domain-containing protein [Anaerolineales bacterium]
MSIYYQEIHEQPDVIEGFLTTEHTNVIQIVEELESVGFSYVTLVARGSSDNAARYAKYLFGAKNRWPVALATPSLFTSYQSPPDLQDSLVIGISQSGQSEDIVAVMKEARGQGALTVAITNSPDSPLASHAAHVIDTHTDVERSIAATKTYTSQLAAIALMAIASSGSELDRRRLFEIPGRMREILKNVESACVDAVQPLLGESLCIVIGRGYNYASVFEISLKLKELAYLVAEPYSPADLMHGPIAMIEEGFPVILIAPQGLVFDEMVNLSQFLRDEKKVSLISISAEREALELAQWPLQMPAGGEEWLSPLENILPGQLLVYHLAKAKGLDPDAPRGLQKITITR